MAIAALEQVGDDAVITRRLDREMDVRRPVMADLRALHQLADGAVHRDRVADRRDRADQERAVRLRAKNAAHPRALDVALRLVEPLAVGLPYVERCALDRLGVRI